jgi:uncharacterized LabA/DUF88 family protein
MRVIAYIDGFNLYYRALKGNPSLKWLNLTAFTEKFLSQDDTLKRVNYYTACVSGERDIDAPRRQNAYFRALKTLPNLTIHYGTFLKKCQCRPLVHEIPLVHPKSPNGQFVLIKSCEEKGSDVNLASHLLRDAFSGYFDAAVVVSADTDLIEPIRIVTAEVRKPVGLIHPDLHRPVSKSLAQVASFVRHVSRSSLLNSQFEQSISPSNGKLIVRPKTWV